MKRNATNIIDWVEHWDHFDYGLYLAILKAKQKSDKQKIMTAKIRSDQAKGALIATEGSGNTMPTLFGAITKSLGSGLTSYATLTA